jgi:single-strand DNA-binding protein
MSDTSITIIGNLTKDPEVRFTNNGNAMVSFSVAVNKSKKNKETGEWDNEAHFFDCTAFGEIADNFANSFTKGNRVIVYGELQQRKYQAQDGTEKTKVELFVQEIGASLRWATVVVNRTERSEGGSKPFAGNQYSEAPRTSAPKPQAQQYAFDEEPF